MQPVGQAHQHYKQRQEHQILSAITQAGAERIDEATSFLLDSPRNTLKSSPICYPLEGASFCTSGPTSTSSLLFSSGQNCSLHTYNTTDHLSTNAVTSAIDPTENISLFQNYSLLNDIRGIGCQSQGFAESSTALSMAQPFGNSTHLCYPEPETQMLNFFGKPQSTPLKNPSHDQQLSGCANMTGLPLTEKVDFYPTHGITRPSLESILSLPAIPQLIRSQVPEIELPKTSISFERGSGSQLEGNMLHAQQPFFFSDFTCTADNTVMQAESSFKSFEDGVLKADIARPRDLLSIVNTGSCKHHSLIPNGFPDLQAPSSNRSTIPEYCSTNVIDSSRYSSLQRGMSVNTNVYPEPGINFATLYSQEEMKELSGVEMLADDNQQCGIVLNFRPYTREERVLRIDRYRRKRAARDFRKKIKYACRKTLADSRPRIKGRFAKMDEA
ncbi:hypothetical protein KP509_04G066000 [Ceratopteris richardii]|uniref:CCT domain-containing protein n=1 Tax=Ceratopteris richardii TaxID=49495 RepID=A0A8T2UXM6_CERRI|nr:hypothetical protein KP509_04G066000 [Ceratopteris richardii]